LLLLRYLFYMNISTLVGYLFRVIFYFIAIFISPIFLLKTTPKHNSIKKEISLSECTKNINHARKFDDYVSVIINVHNGEKFLNETISNALSQTHKNIKIIVYDNYSQDKTADICKKYENKISNENTAIVFPMLFVIMFFANYGYKFIFVVIYFLYIHKREPVIIHNIFIISLTTTPLLSFFGFDFDGSLYNILFFGLNRVSILFLLIYLLTTYIKLISIFYMEYKEKVS